MTKKGYTKGYLKDRKRSTQEGHEEIPDGLRKVRRKGTGESRKVCTEAVVRGEDQRKERNLRDSKGKKEGRYNAGPSTKSGGVNPESGSGNLGNTCWLRDRMCGYLLVEKKKPPTGRKTSLYLRGCERGELRKRFEERKRGE